MSEDFFDTSFADTQDKVVEKTEELDETFDDLLLGVKKRKPLDWVHA